MLGVVKRLFSFQPQRTVYLVCVPRAFTSGPQLRMLLEIARATALKGVREECGWRLRSPNLRMLLGEQGSRGGWPRLHVSGALRRDRYLWPTTASKLKTAKSVTPSPPIVFS